MNKETSKLQLAIYIGTIAIIFVVVLILLGIIPGIRNTNRKTFLTIWGIHPYSVMKDSIDLFEREYSSIKISYVEKSSDTFENDLINALAIDTGPDMWLIPDTMLHRMRDKITPVPSVYMTQREFEETNIEAAGDIFFQNGLILGIPLAIDPLVLFWNKDLFAGEALSLPPTTWDEFLIQSIRLTKKNGGDNITRAGSAMGLARNIPHAKDIMSLLILQGGTAIVDPATKDVTLGESRIINSINVSPTESALRFYTDFGKREKTSYSWNSTFSNPVSAFAREDLAMFVGRASDLTDIMKANVHVNIGVALVPQYTDAPLRMGYGRTEGFVVSRTSTNQEEAWQVAKFFASEDIAPFIAANFGMAPVRRSVLARGHENSIFSIMYEEARRARTWYDPHEKETDTIFTNMIQAVLAGREPHTAATEAHARLTTLLDDRK
ncbi:MAG: hypothetical protein COU90_01560 [Candidatus Ryanbacteria bacterium CG10_big_fil_rev_8_21_14_0_10_43_42]|uniref:ABC transporter substrate-binding protein n=1 Tax=Candidatus Ryanbacteria bacterium CG10_big_fil_rev_8_21_14_0_10_43_42 TaxID=1974864 RepID=A0A2M8KX57_9BACT|nr:MAG: hypothetical protein COU90_01560 [Candidatus Ryanbacteria bacterium CG10_big_fil_rev_8_21_14_0_10_43_42]